MLFHLSKEAATRSGSARAALEDLVAQAMEIRNESTQRTICSASSVPV